jgi:hypothetical protein
METQLAPLIVGIWAEIGSAIAIILIGVWAETGGVNKKSVGANLLGLFLMLVTAGLDMVILPLLTVYFLFGLFVYSKKWRRLYFFFSSKTYGCLMLGIALLHTATLQGVVDSMVAPVLLTDYVSVARLVALSTGGVMGCWFLATPFAYLAGAIYKANCKKR